MTSKYGTLHYIRVDQVGRIVIPMAVRDYLNIKLGDRLELTCDNDTMTIKRLGNKCQLCGSNDNLTLYNNNFLCKACITAIKENF